MTIMTTLEQATSALCVSLLICHELDAVRCREWIIFPGLSMIRDDELAYRLFVLAHAPLMLLVLWAWLASPWTLCVFANVHLGLHLLYARHPRYPFRSRLSWALIVGAAAAGAVSLSA